MSLDIYLTMVGTSRPVGSGIFVREDGQTKEISREEWDEKFPNREPVVAVCEEETYVFSANITHNLTTMADEAGIYEYLWRPEDKNITHAHQLINPLDTGLKLLKKYPDRFKELNPSNGWGDYKGLVSFVEEYLKACKRYPTAEIRVWR